MLHTTAIRNSALTSGSCGCGSNESQKKIAKSICPSEIFAPICRSPQWTTFKFGISRSSSSPRIVPVEILDLDMQSHSVSHG